jgi:hypothetical protein
MGKRRSAVVGIAAAGLGVLVAQPLAGVAATLPQHGAGAAVPTLSVPTVTVPTVTVPTATVPTATVPTATVPPVSTPVGTTPSVTTPKVTTPTVTTPTATTPSKTVPSVTTPRVSTPVGTVPSATTPSAATPAAPGVVRSGASQVSGAPGAATHRAPTPGAPGDPASVTPQTDAATSGAGGHTSSAGGSTPSTSGGATSANAVDVVGGRHGASRLQSPRARRLAAARESRQLRRLVARLGGCLGTLDGRAQHLLSLRAGLHGPARSAAATARILHVRTRREAMLERLAIRALGRSAATGCAGSPAAVASALASAGLPALSSLPPGSASTGSGPSASFRAGYGTQSPQPRPRGGRTLAITPSRARTEQAETGASFPSAVVTALLVMLLAIAMVMVPKLRHRAAPVPAGPVSVPRPQRSPAARAIRAQVVPMDSAVAPMAAEAFSRMATDADEATSPGDEPRAEGETGGVR